MIFGKSFPKDDETPCPCGGWGVIGVGIPGLMSLPMPSAPHGGGGGKGAENVGIGGVSTRSGLRDSPEPR